jgi:bifunctional non-homologous end joining protein LigD
MRDDVKPENVAKEPDISRPAVRASIHRATVSTGRSQQAADSARKPTLTKAGQRQLLDQLDAIESGSGSGVLELPAGHRLEVSNLKKVFWPSAGRGRAARALTKGDLFRHYVRVAPALLPTLSERPLVMKRFPNGVTGKPFYQHRAPGTIPAGVRVAAVDAGTERRPHLIGGDLTTLLYTAQLASISQDPWLSRVGSEDIVDHVAIDLDPPDGLPFARVLEVALGVRDALASIIIYPGFETKARWTFDQRVRPGNHVTIGAIRRTFTPLLGSRTARSCPRTDSTAPPCNSGTAGSTRPPLPAPSTASPTRTAAA